MLTRITETHWIDTNKITAVVLDTSYDNGKGLMNIYTISDPDGFSFVGPNIYAILDRIGIVLKQWN